MIIKEKSLRLSGENEQLKERVKKMEKSEYDHINQKLSEYEDHIQQIHTKNLEQT